MESNLNDFRNKTIFLSGPMTGYENYNKEAFFKHEMEFRNKGFSSIRNPAVIGEKYGYNEDYNFYIRKSLAMLLEADAIFVFGNYEKSKGVNMEIELAHKVGIPVFYEEYLNAAV